MSHRTPALHRQHGASLVIALMFLIVGFGWAKPVPVRPEVMRRPTWDLVVTLAGPFSNLLLAFGALILHRAFGMMDFHVAGIIGTVLYLWQFPHFMAIAWLYRSQYSAAGLRMLTVDDPSGLRAAGQSLAAALAMVPVSLVLAVPSGSIRLFLAAAVASIVYGGAAVRFAVRRDDASARTLLFVSLGSLLALLTATVLFGQPRFPLSSIQP
jgi:protoheme IX farnesyltransferase